MKKLLNYWNDLCYNEKWVIHFTILKGPKHPYPVWSETSQDESGIHKLIPESGKY